MQSKALDLGRVGIWSTSMRFAPGDEGPKSARLIEELGYRAAWIPGGIDDGVLAAIDRLLDATEHLRIASGILNIWKHEPAEVAAWFAGQAPERRARIMLGLGVSHGPLIGEAWAKPLAKMRAFLDGLAQAGMPSDQLCLAALGPKMLALAAERTAGAHPYMVTAAHTALARRALGPDALLAPELGVVLDDDAARARDIARGFVGHYARLPNYVNNWRRDGFSDAEIESLDDRLIDAVVACGDLSVVKARLDAYFTAGADHVCLQPIGPNGMVPDIERDRIAWRELATLI